MRHRQLRQAEDKVYADVTHSGFLKDGIGPDSLGGRVATVHKTENLIVKRLDPHADPVHAQFQKALHIGMAFLDDVLRIHLHSKFIKWFPMTKRCKRADNLP